jgi:predicted nuclease of predicted toxin-antitoxin system
VNFLADESVERQIVDRLRQDGHNVLYVAETDAGISDQFVLNWANENFATLITSDKDFGDLVFRDKLFSTKGIILVRLAGLSSLRKAEILSELISSYGEDLWDKVAVVTPGRIRFRTKVE